MKNFKEESMKYFFKMGEKERTLVENWFLTHKAKTLYQEEFYGIIAIALEIIDYDYRIATIEPSISKDGEIYFHSKRKVAVSHTCAEWNRMVKNYAPEYNSKIATICELYLWYAYRIAMRYWSIEYVCDDSSKYGNYSDSPETAFRRELSGVRNVGGFCDGIGNTFKLVKHDCGYILCGGSYKSKGKYNTVAKYISNVLNSQLQGKSSPVIVLKD